MDKEQTNRTQNMILARYILSRLLVLGAQVQVHSLDFTTGSAIVHFDPSRADTVLLAALAGGAA